MTTLLHPEDFPTLRNLSAAWVNRLVLVPDTRAPKREYIYIPVPAAGSASGEEARQTAIGFFVHWGMAWESGPYRVSYFEPDRVRRYIPERIATLLEQDQAESEFHLVPRAEGERNYAYDALYHLLPLRTVRRFGLPVRTHGCWPANPEWGLPDTVPSETRRLQRAFAHHVWPLLSPVSPMSGFSKTDSLVLLAHDLDFWFPHLDAVIEDRLRDYERCAITDDDFMPESIEADRARIQPTLPPGVSVERPRKGGQIWYGEEDAWCATQELVDRADANGRLRSLIDAIRSGRERDDFSPIWTKAKEDFERKLFKKRSRARVSFVELHDTAVVHGPEAETVDTMLWKNLFATVDPRDRRVVVCLRAGSTHVGDIASELGYKNHSPVSKALKRIRAVAEKLLD